MSDYSDVQASYGRCVRNRDFIPGFYQRLLSKDERIAALLKRTNWSVQNRALRRGISIALTWAGGSKIVDRQLKEMADVHSRQGYVPVDPVLYVYWREALMESVRLHDPQLTPELESKWSEALKKTTDYFIERY